MKKFKLDWLILPMIGAAVVLLLWTISSATWAKELPSPKKTWEGTLGGMILCSLTIFLVVYSKEGYFSERVINYTLISAISAITGTFGDLLESKLKRMAGVKDSGQIMPGHGGFLDRFDSLVLATPFVWLYVHYFLR